MLNKLLPDWQMVKRVLGFCLKEGWPVVVIGLASMIELAHIATSSWLPFYSYLNDSLTLVAIRQVFAHKEPFTFIFSSGFNVFPECIYFVISIIFKSVRSSIYVNALLNMALLYILFRFIASRVLSSRLKGQFFGLIASLVFLVEMLLERMPFINESAVATLFLFNTYYYGTTLSALFVTGLYLLLLNRQKVSFKKNLWLLVLINLASGLATFSNPLFVIEFLAPLLIILLFFWIIDFISFSKLIFLYSGSLIGAFIGYMARGFFKRFIGQNTGSHINPSAIPQSLTLLHATVRQYLDTNYGKLELGILLITILVSTAFALFLINKNVKRTSHRSQSLILVSLLGITVTVTCLLFVVFTGTRTTRYLVIMFIFPLLGLLPVFDSAVVKKYQKSLSIITALVLILFTVWGIISIPNTNNLLNPDTYPDAACLEASLDHKPANGAAGLTDAKPLDIYGQNNERVLQVTGGVSIYPWLANLADYSHKTFTFVIVDRNSVNNGIYSYQSVFSILRAPNSITPCQTFWVFRYNPSSTGYVILNKDIQSSYQADYRLWQEDKTADLF
ncbi:MAG TPA: hypothetical protein VMR95_03955 [Candidatus Binatia bacterium]|nr:hypothetical protein [Candidatus Binatia bacterium]